jgi:hypothetical protein
MQPTPQSSNRLMTLCNEHRGKVSDKWESYIEIYDDLFRDKSDSVKSILEIGIQNGGSLEIWSSYFRFAEKIYGVDINPMCKSLKFDDERIKVFVGDVNTTEVLNDMSKSEAQFDIIIDDGSHSSSDIIRSFVLYFPRLKPGGIYIVEDLHASYWDSHEGALNYAFSSIEFLKKLIDIVNFQHWGVSKVSSDIFQTFVSKYNLIMDEEALLRIRNVYFQDSICVISKSLGDDNPLGVRRIFGKDASIDDSVRLFNNQLSKSPSQEKNLFSNTSGDGAINRFTLVLPQIKNIFIKRSNKKTSFF